MSKEKDKPIWKDDRYRSSGPSSGARRDIFAVIFFLVANTIAFFVIRHYSDTMIAVFFTILFGFPGFFVFVRIVFYKKRLGSGQELDSD